MPSGARELLVKFAKTASADDANQHQTGDADAYLTPWLMHHGLHLVAYDKGLLDPQTHANVSPHVALAIANNTVQNQAFESLLTSIKDAGMTTPLVFKGSALNRQVYSEPWHRPKTDHDILIPDHARQDLHELFLSQQLIPVANNSGQLLSYQCSYGKPLLGQAHLNVDVHWRTSNRQMLAHLFSYNELMARSQVIEDCIHAPCTADSIILSALHIIGHHLGNERLVWFYDLYLLSKKASEEDYEHLLELLHSKQMAGLVTAALNACELLFGEVLPNHVREKLIHLSAQPEPTQVLLRHQHSRWRLFWWDLKALSGLGQRLTFIREMLVPSAQYMRHEFNTQNLWLAHWRRLTRRLLKP